MVYSRGTSNSLERITLSDQTHMTSMTDLVDIDVETLKIDSECSLEKEFAELIRMNIWMIIIPNWQTDWFMSRLYMQSFDLRHQRHLVDIWTCFDYNLRIPSREIRHEVLKDACVVKMRSFGLGIWEYWLEEWDAMKSLAKVMKILDKEFLMIFYTHQYKLEWSIRV